MKGALYLLDQLRDIVQREARPEVAEIAGCYPEGLSLRSLARKTEAALHQTMSQRFVHDVLEGPAGLTRFRLEFGRHIVIQGEGSSHVEMLQPGYREVNPRQFRFLSI